MITHDLRSIVYFVTFILSVFEKHYVFHMLSVRKHIHGLNVSDLVLNVQKLEVACLSSRVTAHIHNAFRLGKENDITHIVDRVGGGDSFMGGLIYGLISYPEDDQKALNFAVAASCLKHTIYGDYNQVTVAEVENLMKGDGSGRVSR